MISRRTLRNIAAVLLTGIAIVALFRERLTTAVIDYVALQYIGPVPEFTHTASDIEEVRVVMRDGVNLHTRIYRPEGEGPWPTVLVRDPYQWARFLSCHFLVRYGYACVHQDVRGQGESEGEWYPLKHEADDGLDTLTWLDTQAWQNGKVALFGASYLGLVQWAVADRLPASVKTIVPSVSHGDFYRIVYHGGHFTEAIAGIWSAEIFYPLQDKGEIAELWLQDIYPFRPAVGVDRSVFKGAWNSYFDFISHPSRSDPYWSQAFWEQLRNAHRQLDVPALVFARWQDFFLEGTLKVFDELPSRDTSLLVIQPGGHTGSEDDLPYAGRDYPELATSLAWLDHFLRGAPLPERLRPGIVYYENGADSWSRGAAWPPRTKQRVFRLGRLEQAVACAGLLREAGATEAQATGVSYRYDPANPVPTRGGAFLLNDEFSPIAVAEQGSTLCERADTLGFLTGPFMESKRLAGPINVSLTVASDAEDTAFTAKLSEVLADGRVLNIRDSITTLAYRNSASEPLSYQPGTQETIQVPLAPIDWTLQAGSRLRLEISSSNAPAFQPHPNVAGPWAEIAETKVATQTLYGGELSLPFVVTTE